MPQSREIELSKAISMPGSLMNTTGNALDVRYVAKNETDRTSIPQASRYVGLQVYQEDTKTLYVLKDNSTAKGTWEKLAINGQDLQAKNITVSQSILPTTNGQQDIGSPDKRFRSIYVDEAYLSTNTLYIGDTPILGTDADTVMIKADPDQSINLRTSGTGTAKITSQSTAEISTSGMNADVVVQATGQGSMVRASATEEVRLEAPDVSLKGNVSISKDLTVDGNVKIKGSTFEVDSTTVTTKDNIIVLNKGEVGSGVTKGTAGIQVDRGDATDYQFIFDEQDDMFKIGMSGDLQTVATRPYVDSGLAGKANASHSHSNATTSAAGFMSNTDKAKLDGIAANATKVEKSSTNGNIKINGTETPVYVHPAGTNPHGTTKADVGLGNVPNVATNDQTPTFTQSSTLANLTSGEKLSSMLGKVSKAITDLTSHISNRSNPHGVTASQIGAETPAGSQAKVDAHANNEDVHITAEERELLSEVSEKAPLASPTFTGTPKAPTASAGTNSTQVATTAFVTTAVNNKTSVSGNAGTATKLQTARKIGNASFDGSADITLSQIGAAASSHTHSAATTSANGFMSASDKAKLDGIAAGANNYVHPETHDASMIVESEEKRFVSDDEKATWNAKANASHTHTIANVTGLQSALDGKAATSHTHSAATSTVAGFMSASDKAKLDGIATGATKVTVDSALSSSSTNPVQNKVINTALAGKANSSHTHAISDVTNLQSTLDGKASTSHTHSNATTSAAGFMSSSDKSKLDGIASGAQANQNAFSNVVVGSTTIAADSTTDSLTLVAGSNVTITPDATNDKITIAAKDTTYGVATGSANGLMSSTDKSKLDGIAAGANNYIHPATHDASMITESSSKRFVSDSEKSTWNAKETTSGAQAKADAALSSAKSYTDTKVAALVNSAPEALDTLGELAEALQENEDAYDSLLTTVGGKADKTYVDTELAKKANSSHTHAISNITNLQSSLDAKAPLASPTLTGTPKAPTAAAGTNTTQIATTQFVTTAVNNKTSVSGNAGTATKLATARKIGQATFDGTADINLAQIGAASTDHLHEMVEISGLQSALNAKAPLASPALTGTPTAPTASAGTNNTQVATTAFVTTAVNNKTSVSGNAGTATKLQNSRTISLAGDVTGSASFDGSANATITAVVADNSHNHYTNTIVRNANTYSSGDVTTIDQTLIDVTSGCRTAFMPANAITVEYSTDGGSTWVDYGLTDDQKMGLFSMNRGHTVNIGGPTGGQTVTTNMQTRVTVAPTDRYTGVDMFYVWFGTSGHTCTVDIERSTIGNKTTFTNIKSAIPVNGWSGNNVVNFAYGTFGGGDNQTSNNYAYRFTFKITAVGSSYPTSKPNLTDLRMYGKNAWGTPNNMMKAGSVYSWDNSQNVTFPKKVTATSFSGPLSGNASTATKLATARKIGNASFDGSADISLASIGAAAASHTHNYAGSSSAGGAANSAVKLATARTINGVAFDGTANITVADSTKLPLSGGTLTGELKAQRVVPSTKGTYNLGKSGTQWNYVYAHHFEVEDSSGNYVGGVHRTVDGTTTGTGTIKLTLGNVLATGTNGNSAGHIELYGSNTGRVIIQPPNSDGSYTVTLPAKTGTLATTDDTLKNGGTIGGNTTVNGVLGTRNVVPQSDASYDLGTTTNYYHTIHAKNYDIYSKANVMVGTVYSGSTGTTSVDGTAYLQAGNSKASGTDGNARGVLKLFGRGTGSTDIVRNDNGSGSYSLELPQKSGTIATTGDNVASATKLATARTINGTNFDGTANITTANWGTARTLTIGNSGKSVNGAGNVSWTLAEIGAAAASHNHTTLTGVTSISFATESSDTASITTTVDGTNSYFDFNMSDDPTQNDQWRWRFTPSGGTVFNAMVLDATSTTAAKLTVAGNVTATSFSGSLSGNATTATTLQTARTINGTSFNGSGNITTAQWGTARTLTIGNSAKSVNGSANVSWSLSEIGAASTAVATTSANGLMSASDKSKLDSISGITTITKTLKVTTSWQDTGITGSNLATGSYILQMNTPTDGTGNYWSEMFTGTMSWYAGQTNNTDADEIVLHKAGHASGGGMIYLRTIRSASSGYLKLQIAASADLSASNMALTFKFRKLI